MRSAGAATGARVLSRTALMIVNPHSRRGAGAHDAVRAALEGGGLSVLVRDCDGAEAIGRAIRESAGQVDRVVLGGGDGTLNAAAPALIETGLPLGVIPLGTANDLARTLGLPDDAAQAAAVVAAGRRRRIDMGEVNGQPFFNVASLGLGVDLTRALTRDAKRRWGVLGYAVAGLRVLRRLAPFTAVIDDGTAEHRSRTVHICVGNGRHYGGGMTVEADATVDDGKLDFYSLEVAHWWRLIALLPALRRGTHGRSEDVRAFSTTEIVLRTKRPRPVNTDGELTTSTPAHFKVMPKAVRIVAPPRSQRPGVPSPHPL